MDYISAVVLIFVIVLSCFLLVAFLRRHSNIEGNVKTSLGTAHLRIEKSQHIASSGHLEVSDLSAKNIKIQTLTAAEGNDITEGTLIFEAVEAENDIDIGSMTGLKRTKSED